MMDDDALLAAALTLLQQETSEQFWRGALLKRPEKRAPVAHIPTMSDVCSEPIEYEALSCGIGRKCA